LTKPSNYNDATLSLYFTLPQRLQNPKLEKAEILDLAVHYIKKTTRKTETKGKFLLLLPVT